MKTCPNCQHTFESTTKTPPLDKSHLEFNDFLVMADTILAHVRDTGDRIVSHDNPMTRRIGFETVRREGPTARRWTIPLTRLKDWSTSDPRADLYRSYTMFSEGRILLASIWSHGNAPTAPYAPPK